ncbi:hypothetical protein GGD56_000644 [Rhizobium mongolense]|uniref:Uncharacterized protein n=2 Tax=Rhizobium mongolense TaxID=57676 RepID=A0ABR6IG42_9HYPH|nr:hypothetical protein [Rhizobium mongolense]TVZ74047.1 hypothetical protein BCL32_2354 [Rhizobium mongolense USDA 1844]
MAMHYTEMMRHSAKERRNPLTRSRGIDVSLCVFLCMDGLGARSVD